ncbi:MAG: glycosyltransferase family 39 protein [Bacteroidetes bacterium]|nr:glycosyltransferase family 39 protein [Bacteroidota bacterium]
MSELPLVYYIAAKLYTLFGFHDYYIRLLHFSIFILGLLYLIKIASIYTKEIILQLLPCFFTLSSPLLFFYGANFLPDVSALSFSIVGFYYFIKYNRQKKLKYIFLFCFFFVLAGLLKISAIILFVATAAFVGIKSISSKTEYRSLVSKQKITLITLYAISFLLLYSWVQYDKYIAEIYQFGGNLFDFRGIWESDKEHIIYIVTRLYENWMHVVMPKYIWLALAGSILLLVIHFKSVDSMLRIVIPITALLVITYLLSFFAVFDVHDYYLVTSFCLPILIFIALIDLIEKKQWMTNWKRKLTISGTIILLLGYATYKSGIEQHFRYFTDKYGEFNQDYYSVEPYLRSIGIKKDDLVVSIPDPSPNVTLYLMNQIGFTECYNSDNYNINYFAKNEKAKFLIVGDSSYFHNELYKPFCVAEKKVGSYKSISIFKLQE